MAAMVEAALILEAGMAENLDRKKNEIERSGMRIVSEIERQEKAA